MKDTAEDGEPTGDWVEVVFSRRDGKRVVRAARRAGLPVEEYVKRAALARAGGGARFTTNVINRARWIRSHGGHPDPAWPLGEQLAVALVLDDDEFLQAAGCTRQQAIKRLDWDLTGDATGDAEAWIADVRAIL
jgi:hypothetical protein